MKAKRILYLLLSIITVVLLIAKQPIELRKGLLIVMPLLVIILWILLRKTK